MKKATTTWAGRSIKKKNREKVASLTLPAEGVDDSTRLHKSPVSLIHRYGQKPKWLTQSRDIKAKYKLHHVLIKLGSSYARLILGRDP